MAAGACAVPLAEGAGALTLLTRLPRCHPRAHAHRARRESRRTCPPLEESTSKAAAASHLNDCGVLAGMEGADEMAVEAAARGRLANQRLHPFARFLLRPHDGLARISIEVGGRERKGKAMPRVERGGCEAERPERGIGRRRCGWRGEA